MIVIGIDPGVSGAIARVGSVAPDEVHDIPTFPSERNGKRRTDYQTTECSDLLEYLADAAAHVFIEDMRPRPMKDGQRDSLVSARQMGVAIGMWLGIAGAIGLPIHIIQPVAWKRYHKLLKANKDASRALAASLYPRLSDKLSLKKDHNRAEALLIASYGHHRLSAPSDGG